MKIGLAAISLTLLLLFSAAGAQETRFAKIRELADQAGGDCRDMVAAYDSARSSRAADLAPKTWRKADRAFSLAVQKLEDGRSGEAQKAAGTALSLLRQAELEAIQADLLGPARATLSQAENANARKLSPVSYLRAGDALKQAEEAIAADRYNRNANSELAHNAAYAARHALYLAKWIAQLREDGNWEKLILEFEGDVSDFSAAMGDQAQFDQGLIPPVETVRSNLRLMLSDRDRFKTEGVRKDSLIGQLEAENQRLRAQSGQVASELADKRQELDRKQRTEEKISRLMALFKPSDGVVLQQSGSIILRLTGLQFATGKADLKASSTDLLDRVQKAIAEFPERRIEIQGHTDSQGEDQANLELSQKRAQAVKDYLMEKMGLPEARLSAVGLGETVPVASNDTAAGRALNRRIEIVLKP